MNSSIKRSPAFDDNTEIWFGKHKGTRLCDVPASYLQWLYGELEKDGYGKPFDGGNFEALSTTMKDKYKLYNYIFNSYDAIQMELGEKE